MKKLLALLLCCVFLSQSGCCRGRLLRWRPFWWRNCDASCRQDGCHTACRDGCHDACHDGCCNGRTYSPGMPVPYSGPATVVPQNTLPPPGNGTLPE
jgi:hypothetical protein